MPREIKIRVTKLRLALFAFAAVFLQAFLVAVHWPEPPAIPPKPDLPRLRAHEALAEKLLGLAGENSQVTVHLDLMNDQLCGYASVKENKIRLTDECAFPLRGIDGRYHWPAVQILAHEIGHIAHRHASTADEKTTPQWQQDEADEFSGWAMRELGASLNEALSSVDEFDFHTHKKLPGNKARRAAIERGWRRLEAAHPRQE